MEKIVDKIGNTPLLEIRHKNSKNKFFVKLESKNPGGSCKDRAALYMLNKIKNRNKLKVIEATSGNTGISLAMLGAAMEIPVSILMPENMSQERIKIMRSYGAEVILTPKEEGMAGSVKRAKEMAEKNPSFVEIGQFSNKENTKAHYETTGPEIWEQTSGDIDIFIAGIGTGGTLSGIGKFLKERNPNIKVIGIEPKESPLITEGRASRHNIQGIGANFIPEILDSEIYDEIITVSYEESIDKMKELAQKEGIFSGISSGACLAAMEKVQGENLNIVGILPDGGERYLSII